MSWRDCDWAAIFNSAGGDAAGLITWDVSVDSSGVSTGSRAGPGPGRHRRTLLASRRPRRAAAHRTAAAGCLAGQPLRTHRRPAQSGHRPARTCRSRPRHTAGTPQRRTGRSRGHRRRHRTAHRGAGPWQRRHLPARRLPQWPPPGPCDQYRRRSYHPLAETNASTAGRCWRDLQPRACARGG
jgi:hypothetical protein